MTAERAATNSGRGRNRGTDAAHTSGRSGVAEPSAGGNPQRAPHNMTRVDEIRARLDAYLEGSPMPAAKAWSDWTTHAPADLAYLLAEHERLREALTQIAHQATDLPHAQRIDRDAMRAIASEALAATGTDA